MSLLPDPGLTRYGAFTFPVETNTTGIEVTPVFDQAGRTVIYSRIIITLETRLVGRAIDAAVRTVVRILSKPAFPFIYAGRGLGLAINVGGVRDVVWGPKPLGVSVKPLGGGNAVRLTWKVEVCIPDCTQAVYAFSPMEFNFGLSFDIAPNGYTTRTYAGFVRIPMTRITPTNRRLPDSADEYREKINPPMLVGFRRASSSFTIDESKCRLDFTIQDVQLPPNIPPVGIIEASADHTLASTPGKLVEWTGTLNATYEIARNGKATPDDATRAFFALAKDRVNHTLGKLPPPTELTAGGAKGSTKAVVIPISFTMAEPQIYGPTVVRYTLVYRVVNATLSQMLKAAGLWRPVPGSDYKLWAASVAPVVGPRGHAGLIFSPGDDEITDLCSVPQHVDLTSGAGRRAQAIPGIPPGVFPEPTPDASWLSYTNAIFLEVDGKIVAVQTLPEKARKAENDVFGGSAKKEPGGSFNPFEKPPADVSSNPFYTPPTKGLKAGDTGGTPQRVGKQSGYLFMVGAGVRAGFPIPCPTLATYDDAKLTPANRQDRGEGFAQAVVGNVGVAVVAARWRLRFLMESIPDEPLPLPTPYPAAFVPGVGGYKK